MRLKLKEDYDDHLAMGSLHFIKFLGSIVESQNAEIQMKII